MTGTIKKILDETAKFILNFSLSKYIQQSKILVLIVAAIGLAIILFSGLLFGF